MFVTEKHKKNFIVKVLVKSERCHLLKVAPFVFVRAFRCNRCPDLHCFPNVKSIMHDCTIYYPILYRGVSVDVRGVFAIPNAKKYRIFSPLKFCPDQVHEHKPLFA